MTWSRRVGPIVVFASLVVALSLGARAQSGGSTEGSSEEKSKAVYCVGTQAPEKLGFLLGTYDARGLSCGGHPEIICWVGGQV